jgi:drug/metabolite transporter (DMT)-like permease
MVLSPRIALDDHAVGLLCSAASAMMFGIVASMVKSAALPPLVMVECRGLVQWMAAFLLCIARFYTTGREGRDSIAHILMASPAMRSWQLVRALLYWSFQLLWWAALVSMPLGDATALVYCGPLFTGAFAHIMLREPLTRIFFVCAALDIVGVCLIVQPSQVSCVLKGDCESDVGSSLEYYTGALLALGSAAVAGLLPVAVRKSREVHWTTVEHLTAALTTFVFTPVAALGVWLWHRVTKGVDYDSISSFLPANATLTGHQVTVICGAAAIEFVGLALQTVAYQRVKQAASASLVNYIEVPFAFWLQLTFFRPEGDLRSAALGAGLIVFAGGVHLSREFPSRKESAALTLELLTPARPSSRTGRDVLNADVVCVP